MPIQSLLRCTVATILLSSFSSAFAVPVSIYEASIKWEDEAKTKLLEAAPRWQQAHIASLFNTYQHPENYRLPETRDNKQYNTLFINAFWGPLDNPFSKYARPAKAFMFFSEAKQGNSAPKIFYTAPLMRDETDNNYYVFDKNNAKPILLNDWVNNLKNTHADLRASFNVCNGYANLPGDSCEKSTYQKELSSSVAYNLKAEEIVSAKRALNEDWRTKVERHNKFGNSIEDEATHWSDKNARQVLLNQVITWPNYSTIQANFEKIRNVRYFQDENKLEFLRRISWLFPDDGCWTRAAAAIKDLFGPFNNPVSAFPRPSKVFAFGDLCANTPNSASGYVSWWYHTAPIIRDAETNKTYVLDPSVDPHKPLTMEAWVEAITSQSGGCSNSRAHVATFAVCNGHGSTPYDYCNTTPYSSEVMQVKTQLNYQGHEFWRQKDLGRDPSKVLGDSPPWLN